MTCKNDTTKSSVYASQNSQILRHLQERGPITAIDAMRLYQCWRLSARIYDLRHKFRIPIRTEHVTTATKTFARYHLVQEPEHADA